MRPREPGLSPLSGGGFSSKGEPTFQGDKAEAYEGDQLIEFTSYKDPYWSKKRGYVVFYWRPNDSAGNMNVAHAGPEQNLKRQRQNMESTKTFIANAGSLSHIEPIAARSLPNCER